MPHIPKRVTQPASDPSQSSVTSGVRREVMATQPRKKLEIKKVEPPIKKKSQMMDRVSPWDYDVDPNEVERTLFPEGLNSNG